MHRSTHTWSSLVVIFLLTRYIYTSKSDVFALLQNERHINYSGNCFRSLMPRNTITAPPPTQLALSLKVSRYSNYLVWACRPFLSYSNNGLTAKTARFHAKPFFPTLLQAVTHVYCSKSYLGFKTQFTDHLLETSLNSRREYFVLSTPPACCGSHVDHVSSSRFLIWGLLNT